MVKGRFAAEIMVMWAVSLLAIIGILQIGTW
jgi:hypothetical protein